MNIQPLPDWMADALENGTAEELGTLVVSTHGYIKELEDSDGNPAGYSHGEDFVIGFEMLARDEHGAVLNEVGEKRVTYVLSVAGAVTLCRVLMAKLPLALALAVTQDAIRAGVEPVKIELPGLPEEPVVPASEEGRAFVEGRGK